MMKLTRISRGRYSSSRLWPPAAEASSHSFFDEVFRTGESQILSPDEIKTLFLPNPLLYWTNSNSNSNPNPPSSTPRRCFKFDFWATILFFPNAIFFAKSILTSQYLHQKTIEETQIFVFEFNKLEKQGI